MLTGVDGGAPSESEHGTALFTSSGLRLALPGSVDRDSLMYRATRAFASVTDTLAGTPGAFPEDRQPQHTTAAVRTTASIASQRCERLTIR